MTADSHQTADSMTLANAVAELSPPAAAALVMDVKVRAELAERLRERARWLRYERHAGGNWEHLLARETECLHLAERIEKGLRI